MPGTRSGYPLREVAQAFTPPSYMFPSPLSYSHSLATGPIKSAFKAHLQMGRPIAVIVLEDAVEIKKHLAPSWASSGVLPATLGVITGSNVTMSLVFWEG